MHIRRYLHKILNVRNPARHLVSRCMRRLLAVLRLVVLCGSTTSSLLMHTPQFHSHGLASCFHNHTRWSVQNATLSRIKSTGLYPFFFYCLTPDKKNVAPPPLWATVFYQCMLTLESLMPVPHLLINITTATNNKNSIIIIKIKLC